MTSYKRYIIGTRGSLRLVSCTLLTQADSTAIECNTYRIRGEEGECVCVCVCLNSASLKGITLASANES